MSSEDNNYISILKYVSGVDGFLRIEKIAEGASGSIKFKRMYFNFHVNGKKIHSKFSLLPCIVRMKEKATEEKADGSKSKVSYSATVFVNGEDGKDDGEKEKYKMQLQKLLELRDDIYRLNQEKHRELQTTSGAQINTKAPMTPISVIHTKMTNFIFNEAQMLASGTPVDEDQSKYFIIPKMQDTIEDIVRYTNNIAFTKPPIVYDDNNNEIQPPVKTICRVIDGFLKRKNGDFVLDKQGRKIPKYQEYPVSRMIRDKKSVRAIPIIGLYCTFYGMGANAKWTTLTSLVKLTVLEELSGNEINADLDENLMDFVENNADFIKEQAEKNRLKEQMESLTVKEPSVSKTASDIDMSKYVENMTSTAIPTPKVMERMVGYQPNMEESIVNLDGSEVEV
jgi:hypothetical protein